MYVVFNKLDRGYFCILEGMHEENFTNIILLGCLETNSKKNFLSIFIKKNIYIIKTLQYFIHKAYSSGLWMELE